MDPLIITLIIDTLPQNLNHITNKDIEQYWISIVETYDQYFIRSVTFHQQMGFRRIWSQNDLNKIEKHRYTNGCLFCHLSTLTNQHVVFGVNNGVAEHEIDSIKNTFDSSEIHRVPSCRVA